MIIIKIWIVQARERRVKLTGLASEANVKLADSISRPRERAGETLTFSCAK